MCEFMGRPFGGNGTSVNTLLNKVNIGEGLHTVTILENDLPPTTKGSKDRTQTPYWKKIFLRRERGSNYELAVFLGCKPSANSLI